MGSMYAKIMAEDYPQKYGALRRACPACSRLMHRLDGGDWYCNRCYRKVSRRAKLKIYGGEQDGKA